MADPTGSIPVEVTETVLDTLILRPSHRRLCVHIKNVGAVSLNTFKVSFRGGNEQDPITIYSQATDWNNAPFTSFIRMYASSGAVDNPVSLAPGEDFLFYMEDISAFYDVQFSASVASGKGALLFSIGAGE